jgi:cyclic beta-1,2-glucan synthetase
MTGSRVLRMQNETVAAEEIRPLPIAHKTEGRIFRSAANELAAGLTWLPGRSSSETLSARCDRLVETFKNIFDRVEEAFAKNPTVEDLLWLRNNAHQLSSAARTTTTELRTLSGIPVVSNKIEILPRVLAIVESFFKVADVSFSKTEFIAFCRVFEESAPLEFHEIGALVPALKLILLERIAAAGALVVNDPVTTSGKVVSGILAFQQVAQTSWKDELEALIPFDPILREDPAGAYTLMDIESRSMYRERISQIAAHSDRTEMEVAAEALKLARGAQKKTYSDPRIALRESHIGYYLIGEGSEILCEHVGFLPPVRERFQTFLRRHPDEFLLLGIAVLTLAILAGAVWFLTPASTPSLLLLFSMLVLILPASQAAVQIMNYLTTNLLPATTLPKLDFSQGVPADCDTLVAIPTLLLSESQVRDLVESLEVRYLGNHDRNIHFALVSDLPDSHAPAPEENALVTLCSTLIEDLNARYSSRNAGSFFHLHRHRVYNAGERGWMGWERKRGKLIDLNRLLRGQFDSFPIKIGDLSILPNVRFIITLDSDTELPRGSAQRMIGALAHPLNQAIVDPVQNIVVSGYGILQPRVGISVQCTARSRLAAIFAGETGLDPYSRAISDVYQDLYGEGSFAGKGIYEVDTLLRVLSHRFPRNSLLSHDLIEGAYGRVGLTTDISVIEDYPSHYSAYSRRKHRWLRGDWQILAWLTDFVPDESGKRVPNPISLVSRWKILDNLRRSLVEPGIFALLLFAWFATARPVLWTVTAIALLFLPAWVEFGFAVTRAAVSRQTAIARDALHNLFAANFTVLLTLTLLAHQALLSVDAVLRALVRSLVTRERLLEWETAAEAEAGQRRAPIDRYIEWMPFLSIALGALIWLTRPHAAFLSTIPILALWACSKPFAVWLNRCPIEPLPPITRNNLRLLRKSALHIWRYFSEFCTEEHNWLVPDNVQSSASKDEPYKITASISPTNVGLLLNARQVAQELGYITIAEMADLTQKTLATLDRMEKYRGHVMNWYDTRTLKPRPPLFISSVDSGNLVASLWTLQQGCLELLGRPILSRALAAGFIDYLRALADLHAVPKRVVAEWEEKIKGKDWLNQILSFPETQLQEKKSHAKSKRASDIAWFREQAKLRIEKLRTLVRMHVPWKLPEFAELQSKLAERALRLQNALPLEQLPDLIAELELGLDETISVSKNGSRSAGQQLKAMLAEARQNTLHLIDELRQAGRTAQELAEAMDFRFLVDKQRLLMSVGFDAQSVALQPYFYDLLATEPRTAVFVAIAKDDIPQDCWFRLDRPFTTDGGRPVLLSWTGTMFEYLMPSLWMRSYPNTLLHRSAIAAVKAQQEYATAKKIPWGISESACAKRNEAGDYHYEAFGVPNLALQKKEIEPLIVSPYSTFLALNVDRKAALSNLHWMNNAGWFGSYGFYEAADYTVPRKWFLGPRYRVVHSWMVHHQGMSLLSLANCLCDNVVQHWFHRDRRVQATELLLHEKPVANMYAR